MPTIRKKAAAKVVALTDRALFDLAQRFRDGKVKEKEASSAWRSAQTAMVQELLRRKNRSITDATGVKITLVTPESVVYDSETLFAELSWGQRRRVFDGIINLANFTADQQQALLAVLSPSERRTKVKWNLNLDRLAQAVQDGHITPDVIAVHSSIKPSAPYIRVSEGEAE